MKIGQLVKSNLKEISKHCETVEHQEFRNLLDLNYSKQEFGINFPFCIDVEDIEPSESRRYWTEVYLVRGRRIRVCSQWYERNRPAFIQYLKSKQIQPKLDAEESSPGEPQVNVQERAQRSNSRYRGNAIGNAQNLFIRNVLSRLGNESFSEKDWNETKDYFSRKCAYCGAETDLLIEHAIPINKEKLGEHRLGNLVPSCKACNSRKAAKDFREFLEDQPELIARVEEYMDSRNYVPLEDNEQMRMVLDMAHKEVALLAERYIRIINELFSLNPNESDEEMSDY
jgi:5-methylcytosine-specific restriction endonuclease McrA